MPSSVVLYVGASALGAAVAATNIAAVASFVAGVSLATIATVVTVGTMAVVGSAMARRQEAKAAQAARNQAIANLRDIQSVVRSAVAPQNVVYGRAMVGGVISSWFITGDVSQYHHWTQVIAAHPIDGVDTYWINDEPVTVDANGWVTTPKFCRGDGSGLIRIRLYDGTQTTLDAEMVSASAGNFTASDAGFGRAYLYVRFEADYDVFGQTGAPLVRAVVRGKKLYDPRTGLTTFSDNAALAVRDYLVSDYGLRCTAAEVSDADIIAAANVCDEAVATQAGSQARYTANGAISAATNLKANLETLVDAMAGLAVWSQGQWRVVAGAYQTPVATIGVDDVVQVEDLVAYTPRRELFNTVTGTFVDPANLYSEKQFPLVTNATYVSQDGGQTIERQMAMPLCNDATRAQRMAKIEIERARQAVTVTMLCKWTTYDLTPGDHVSVTIARYGWSGKVFFVAKRELSADGIRYVLRETAAAVWAWNMGEATTVDPAPNTSLPDAYQVPTIAGLAASSGTDVLQVAGDGTVISRILLSWSAIASQYVTVGGRVEVSYRPVGVEDWITIRTDGDATATYLAPVTDGLVYELRARAINAMGQRGAWATMTHTVIGKTEPPPDVQTFMLDGDYLRWTPVSALDLAGYLIRFNYGNNTFWNSAGAIHEGVLTDSPYRLVTRPSGVVTLMIKAVDTSGNESDGTAVIVANLGDPVVENVLVSWPEAPTFAGTITNGAVSGSVLQAVTSDKFYGDDSQPFYTGDVDLFYPPTTYAQMVYEWSQLPQAAGSLVLQSTIAASDYSIEYLRDSQAAFYGPNSDKFWGAAAEPFYGAPGQWQVWPGALDLYDAELIRWRITTAAGATRGQISQATLVLDVPDISEKLDNVVISAAGTRLPITKAYRAISNVQVTVQADGNGGVTARIEDKNAALGPLITVRNAAGTAVVGLVDADVQGY